MITQLDKDNARLKGIQAFTDGQNFAQSPYVKFTPDDVELRWCWQMGWLRARQDQWDSEKKDKP